TRFGSDCSRRAPRNRHATAAHAARGPSDPEHGFATRDACPAELGGGVPCAATRARSWRDQKKPRIRELGKPATGSGDPRTTTEPGARSLVTFTPKDKRQ